MDYLKHFQESAAAVVNREMETRAAKGLPPFHVLTMEDFPFRFHRDEIPPLMEICDKWLAADAEAHEAIILKATCSVSLKDYAGADALMAEFERRVPSDPRASMRFAAAIERKDAILPRVKHPWPKGPSLFVSCDERYFYFFGIPFLRSLAASAPGAAVHVHLIGSSLKPISAVRRLPLALTATVEDASDFLAKTKIKPRSYYNAIRMIRFSEALEAGSGPLTMVDVDSLVAQDPRPLMGFSGDVALRVRPGRIEAWNQFSACMLVGSASGRPYFRAVADIIRNALHAPWWGREVRRSTLLPAKMSP